MRSFRSLFYCQFFFVFVLATMIASGVSEAQSNVPLKASIAITEIIQPSDGCFLEGHISGTGVATRLGKLTLTSIDCINPISPTAFMFSSNQLVLTSAKGDQIFAAYSGFFTITGAVGAISGNYYIIGGTGIFTAASGIGVVRGVEDMTTGTGKVELTGTISY